MTIAWRAASGVPPSPNGGWVKWVMGSATPQKSRPTPIPAAKSMASHETVENSGRSSGLPSLSLPNRENASHSEMIKNPLTATMKNQSMAPKTRSVIANARLDKPTGSTMPQVAMTVQITNDTRKIVKTDPLRDVFAVFMRTPDSRWFRGLPTDGAARRARRRAGGDHSGRPIHRLRHSAGRKLRRPPATQRHGGTTGTASSRKAVARRLAGAPDTLRAGRHGLDDQNRSPVDGRGSSDDTVSEDASETSAATNAQIETLAPGSAARGQPRGRRRSTYRVDRSGATKWADGSEPSRKMNIADGRLSSARSASDGAGRTPCEP